MTSRDARRWAIALAALCVSACAGPPMPSPDDVALRDARVRWPDVTAEQLSRGRELYQTRCATCHRPFMPSAFAPDDWPGRVAAMQARAELRGEERTAIERYLVAMARRDAR